MVDSQAELSGSRRSIREYVQAPGAPNLVRFGFGRGSYCLAFSSGHAARHIADTAVKTETSIPGKIYFHVAICFDGMLVGNIVDVPIIDLRDEFAIWIGTYFKPGVVCNGYEVA